MDKKPFVCKDYLTVRQTAVIAGRTLRHAIHRRIRPRARRSTVKIFLPSDPHNAPFCAIAPLVERVVGARTTACTSGTITSVWRFVSGEHSVMILGPPRSGKTSSLIIPNVLAANGPVVVHVDETRRPRRHARRPFEHRTLPSCSTRPGRSPDGTACTGSDGRRCQSCGTWAGALSMARSLVEVGTARPPGAPRCRASHWTERAQALLAPLLHAAALDGADMRTAPDLGRSPPGPARPADPGR